MSQPLISIHISDEALQLWIELFQSDSWVYSPIIESLNGDCSCFFCHEYQPGSTEQHKPNCIYLRAKAMLEKMVNL